MDHRVFNDLLLVRLSDYLTRHPPTLDEVLGTVWEVYRADPDLVEGKDRTTDMARAVFVYIASHVTKEPTETIGKRVGIDMIDVHRYAITINRRLRADQTLRADLDLACILLVERVMWRERQDELVA